MKVQTRIPPNYGLIVIILTSLLFWIGIIKVFFGQQIKDFILEIISSLA